MFCLLFIEMIHWIDIWLFLCYPISIKPKYEITNYDSISFNLPIIFWGVCVEMGGGGGGE